MSTSKTQTPSGLSQIQHSQTGTVHKFSYEWQGRPLVVETGKLAGQTNGECTLRYGDTVLMVTAVCSRTPREGVDFFPLLVDFDEKFYAAGKIKGSRFIKREGRPSDEAILSGRIVDRSIRPFFDNSLRHEVQVVISVLSWDKVNDPDALAIIAAALTLQISDIPWSGPVAGVMLAFDQSKQAWLVSPTYEQRAVAAAELLVAVRAGKVVMIEAEGTEVSETALNQGFELALAEGQKIIDFINFVRDKIGRPKAALKTETSLSESRQQEIDKTVTEVVAAGFKNVFSLVDKNEHSQALSDLENQVVEKLAATAELESEAQVLLAQKFELALKKNIRQMYLVGRERLYGRGMDELRPLAAEVGLLPRTHGSALFSRGETQALSVVTLGSPADEQILDTMEESDTRKRYMHHYNFPGFSTGEVKPNRGPSRREIGHGALAEKALKRLLPDKETFPYTVRVVTEILSSNGSTSMAATCGSSLALFDAGVPLKKAVAGIAMGFMSDENNPDNYLILTDIQGLEDQYGEMDFKVAGTTDGISAVQLDVKNLGLSLPQISATLDQALTARLKILATMKQAIAQPHEDLSVYAPRIYTLQIEPEKIGDVIGPRGKIINEIIEATGVDIDIDDSGLVLVTSTDAAQANKALEWIKNLTREPEVGEVYQGKITRLMEFGAFVEILPNREGLIHISELAPWHVQKVDDVVKVGAEVPVKVIEIDELHRINLSLKQTNYQYPPEVKARAGTSPDRPERGRPANHQRRPGRSPRHDHHQHRRR
jgi:polyribonucleotide nucleotidyltransferase